MKMNEIPGLFDFDFLAEVDEREEIVELTQEADYVSVATRLDALEEAGVASLREVLLEIKAKLEAQVRGAKDTAGLRTLVSKLKPVRRSALRDTVLELMRRAWDVGKVDAYDEVTVERKMATRPRIKSSFIPRPALQWLRQKAFYISDILGDKILADAKGVILNAIKTGRTTQDALIDLAVVLLPYLGDPAVVQDDEQLTPHRLETIVRTNTTEAYNHGRLTTFVDPEVLPFVDWVRYSAILDTRTTEVCKFLHMKLFKPEASALEELLPPNHFNCRSIVVPVVVGEQVNMADVITAVQIGKAKSLADAKFLTERGAWKNYAANWNEEDHPRHPAGDDKGGEFAPVLSEAEAEAMESIRNEKEEVSVLLDSSGKEITRIRGGAESAPTAIGQIAEGVLIHNHLDDTSFSFKDVVLAGKWAREGRISKIVVGGPTNIFSLSVKKPWTQQEWNAKILPFLEKAERRLAKDINKESGDTLRGGGPVMHRLWGAASADNGPLYGRVSYRAVRRNYAETEIVE